MAVDWTVKQATETTSGSLITYLEFADDVAFMGDSADQLQCLTDSVANQLRLLDFILTWRKQTFEYQNWPS